ncbi:nucleoside-diphosphate-sugar epimerase [Variovorax boronicumulans]|uniref:NAD-dependent epimerase/dehydratase family protein n=1 Tax=Variovorax boronicumulans TaxID=436515 RepID=UPI002476697B|nr:NAD-dependent epimerase/dehydratase family protein [Variovorax boronicumulans]MDH6165392.1 nucleoside-diphosphate-sugar epimerase [Variovorax boronicumulans]
MSEKIFVAGAAGAIGTALVPLLTEAGYEVYGSTRRTDRARALEAQGVTPVVVDVFDAAALRAALVRIAPGIVVHQLTDLPLDLDPKRMPEASHRNARVRTEGTRNLVAAALAAGSRRLVAQSIAWAYAPRPTPHVEDHPLDLEAEGIRRVSVDGVAALERSVLGAAGIQGTVLRYGQIYGPGTSTAVPKGASPVHVEAAAWAAVMALRHAQGGVFNIAEDNPEVSSEKAKRELGWHASLRLPKGLVS